MHFNRTVIRKTISLILTIGMLLVMFGTFSYAKADNNQNYSKISDELKAAIDELGEDECLPVYVILYDLDDESVMDVFEERYPEEYAEYMKARDIDVSETIGRLISDYDKNEDIDGNDFIDPIDDELLQTAIELKREVYREFYSAWNHDVIDKYIAPDKQIFVSQYSQMMIVLANKDEINRLLKDDKLYSISLFVDKKAVSEMAMANSVTRADYVRDNFGNKGSGVKIGMIEADFGKPYSSDQYLSSATINIDSSITMTESPHASWVARIMVGSPYGVAPSATLYCTGCIFESTFYDRIENYLLSNGVNVINMSAGYPNSDGTYDVICQWVDHIAFKHDVHFVKSAGNNGNYITSPGLGYNVITVGGFNTNNTTNNGSHTLSSFSSYKESAFSNRPEKPNLIAPASTYDSSSYNQATCGLNFGDAIDYGTSYAAPQVTGIIAQLCSCSASLKTRQSAMGALLAATCEHKINRVLRTGSTNRDYLFVSSDSITGSSQQISNKEGAGKVDARNARWSTYNGKFWRYTVSTNSFPYTKTFTQSASTAVLNRVAIFWLRQNSLSTPHATGTVTVGAFDDLDLEVIGPNGVSVGTCKTSYSNFEVVQFVPTVGGTYTIKVTLVGTPGNSSEYLGIAIW